jgi:hypothetical protein
MKYICLQLLTVFYLTRPSKKQTICFDFEKQYKVLPIVFYVPGHEPSWFRLFICLFALFFMAGVLCHEVLAVAAVAAVAVAASVVVAASKKCRRFDMHGPSCVPAHNCSNSSSFSNNVSNNNNKNTQQF